MPATSNPTVSDVHVNRPLTNFAQKYLQDEDAFVASRAMPNRPVTNKSDSYYEFDRDDFFRDEAGERAPGTESKGSGFGVAPNNYSAKVYAWHKDVDDQDRANADPGINLDQTATQFVTQKLLIRRERVFADKFFTTGRWATDFSPVAKWDAANSNPITDVKDGKRTVQAATGFRPNKMVIGRAAYDSLSENDEIISRVVGGSTTERPGHATMAQIRELLELEQILIMDAVVTTSAKGAASPARELIGGDNALLYYAPDAVTLDEPSAGVQFSWTGLIGATPNGIRIKRMRADLLSSDRVEGDMSFDMKLTGVDLGYFMNNVST